ncbi:MAG: hypothetical protein ACM3QS_07440 [Bacteroidota bacterium]
MNAGLKVIARRPLSAMAGGLAVLLIIFEVVQIAAGELYQKRLGGIDGTTLIELGVLTLYGIYSLRGRTDLQSVSFTLVNGLSFIFAYEALYKWSFYLTPFRLDMPPAEVRQFVIQAGTALTVLTGFADRLFTIKRWTLAGLLLFIILWAAWLVIGFPQLTGKMVWPQVVPLELAEGPVYLLNRATKLVLWFTYLTLFPPPFRRSEA